VAGRADRVKGDWAVADGRDVSDEYLITVFAVKWAALYEFGGEPGAYWARHLGDGFVLRAATPDGLDSAIRANEARWWLA
jgi:hypothetical protein